MDEPSRDEIDLLDLAVKLVQAIKKHGILLGLSTLLSLAAAYGVWRITPGIYESQMIVVSEIIPKIYGDRILTNLNRLAEEGNAAGLSGKLGISEADAASLRRLEISASVQYETTMRIKKTSVRKERMFYTIKASVTDPQTLPNLQAGLLQFLLHNDLTVEQLRETTERYQMLLREIDSALNDLSLIRRRMVGKEPVPPNQLNQKTDTASVFSEIIFLQERRKECAEKLDPNRAVQLVEGFTIFKQPSYPRLSRYLLIGFLLGITIPTAFLVFTRLLRIANSREAQVPSP